MTIENNSLKSKDKYRNYMLKERENLSYTSFTKEQILLNDLKAIANEYIKLEKIKTEFIEVIIKNLDELDFSGLINYSKYYIKESFLKNQSKENTN